MATGKNLLTQIRQLATTVNQSQQQGSSNIPTQLIINPKGNKSIFTLKSDRELPKPTNVGAKIDDVSVVTLKSDRELPKPTDVGAKIDDVSIITLKSDRDLPKPTNAGAKINDSAKIDYAPKHIALPFPSISIPAKKMELNYDLLNTFRRVEVNIPLLDAIKKIPKYAKFLKDLCTHKRKLKGNEQVKRFHDPKPYIVQKVLLFNFRLNLISGKLWSRWDAFVITNVFFPWCS